MNATLVVTQVPGSGFLVPSNEPGTRNPELGTRNPEPGTRMTAALARKFKWRSVLEG
jgi:hypothetical protein